MSTDWPVWADAATVILGAVALFGIVGWCLRHGLGVARKIMQFLDSWLGEPPRDGLPGRPGVMDRLTSLEETSALTAQTVAAIQAELPKNGVPLARKIDALWTKHLSDEERAREETH